MWTSSNLHPLRWKEGNISNSISISRQGLVRSFWPAIDRGVPGKRWKNTPFTPPCHIPSGSGSGSGSGSTTGSGSGSGSGSASGSGAASGATSTSSTTSSSTATQHAASHRGRGRAIRGLMEAGDMEKGKMCPGWVDVMHQEVHDGAVWANCHQMVLKQVRQQAVTGRRWSVSDGIDFQVFLHSSSVWWTKTDKFYPDAIFLFNPCLHLSQIMLVLTSMPQRGNVEVRTHSFTISIDDMRLMHLTIVFFFTVRERKEQKNIVKRSRLYPFLTENKMWVHWGSMLSIHNTVLLCWLWMFHVWGSAQEDCSAADGHAELQDLLPTGQCRLEVWKFGNLPLSWCQQRSLQPCHSGAIMLVQICFERESIFTQLESGGVKPNLQMYKFVSTEDGKSVRQDSARGLGFSMELRTVPWPTFGDLICLNRETGATYPRPVHCKTEGKYIMIKKEVHDNNMLIHVDKIIWRSTRLTGDDGLSNKAGCDHFVK